LELGSACVTLFPMRVRRATFVASAATAVATLVTAANRLGDLSLWTLASSPDSVKDGKVWSLVTSGLLADRPAVPSLVGFWLVAFVVLLVCPVRVVAATALAGHIVSSLGVYAAIGAVGLVDPRAFSSVAQLADYGLSAIIAAWLGAIARVFWVRNPLPVPRAFVVLGSVGCAAVGFALRPDVTVLDSEHLLAYCIGVALADGAVRARLTRPTRRLAAATASLVLASRGP
jgi:hypothetical protein